MVLDYRHVRDEVFEGEAPSAPPEPEVSSLEAFLNELRAAGIDPKPLKVEEKSPSIWERAGGVNEPVYKISQTSRKEVRLGKWSIAWTYTQSQRFIKCAVDEVRLPMTAEMHNAVVTGRTEVQEKAVFVELVNDPVLAIRVEDQWFELYRWISVPFRVFARVTPNEMRRSPQTMLPPNKP